MKSKQSSRMNLNQQNISQKNKQKEFVLSKERQQQILRKLISSNINTEDDFKRIIKNLQLQNMKLSKQLKEMTQHVSEIIQRKKLDSKPNNKHIESQILVKKRELQQKYSQLDHFKKENSETKLKKGDIQLQSKVTKFENTIKEIDEQIKHLNEQKKVLQKQIKQHNEELAQYNGNSIQTNSKLNQIIQQNRQLKKKIIQQKKKQQQINIKSMKIHSNIINMKIRLRQVEKQQQFNKFTNIKSIKLKKFNKNDDILISHNISSGGILQKQIIQLKNKKYQVESKQQKKRQQLINKKNQLISINQDLIEQSKKLQNQKTKYLLEFNKYSNLIQQLQNKKKNAKELKKYESIQTQTIIIPSLFIFRRDYAGNLGKIRFDDRKELLYDNFNTKIYKITSYENQKGISVIVCGYYDSNDSTKIYESRSIIPQSYLQRNKKRIYQIKYPDFFKIFKIKINIIEKRIVKIQIVTNRNEKFQLGDKKLFQNVSNEQIIYLFDISTNQFPTCIFGSVHQVGVQWFLQSIGAEIKYEIKQGLQKS